MPRGAAGPAPPPQGIVVGDVMLDVVVRVVAPFAHASDTTSSITTSPGGAAANQSVAMARAGADVALVGAVGDDPIGDAAVGSLRAAGVDVRSLTRSSRPTGVVVALVEPDGQRSMLTDRGANLTLDEAAVDAAGGRLVTGTHVHVSGYCLLDEASRAAGLRALELARAHGASTSVDASSATPILAVGPDQFLSWVRGADYFFCNLLEAAVLTASKDATTSASALARHAAEVLVTLGADGAVVVTRDGVVRRAGQSTAAPAAFDVDDTIGAGDSFTAAYLVSRLRGLDVAASLALGAAAASDAVTRRGARGWRSYSRE